MADVGAALEEPPPSGEEAMQSQTACGLDGPCAIDPRRLRLRKSLGAGAFANVKAAQLRPGAPSSAAEYGALSRDGSSEVAVKVLRPELLPHPHQVQQFLKEVDLLRSLRHRCGWGWACGGADNGSGGATRCSGAKRAGAKHVPPWPRPSLSPIVRSRLPAWFKPSSTAILPTCGSYCRLASQEHCWVHWLLPTLLAGGVHG